MSGAVAFTAGIGFAGAPVKAVQTLRAAWNVFNLENR